MVIRKYKKNRQMLSLAVITIIKIQKSFGNSCKELKIN